MNEFRSPTHSCLPQIGSVSHVAGADEGSGPSSILIRMRCSKIWNQGIEEQIPRPFREDLFDSARLRDRLFGPFEGRPSVFEFPRGVLLYWLPFCGSPRGDELGQVARLFLSVADPAILPATFSLAASGV